MWVEYEKFVILNRSLIRIFVTYLVLKVFPAHCASSAYTVMSVGTVPRLVI